MSQPPHLTLVEKPKLDGNRLLMALSEDDRTLLHASEVLVTLKRGDVMILPYEPIEHVYFPIECLGSIVAITRDDRRIEVGIFGREGMSSTSLLLGTNVTPHETFIQVEGSALSNPLTWAGIVGVVLSLLGLVWAGRGRHPIGGALAGLVLGGAIGGLLLMFAVIPLDSVVLLIAPIVGLALGIVWGWLAPLRRTGPDRQEPPQGATTVDV